MSVRLKFRATRLFALVAWIVLATLAYAQENASDSSTTKTKYTEISVANGGSVKGKVTFKGEVPKLTLVVNQDKVHCTHADDGSRPSPRLRVGPEGGLADTVVYLKEIAQGKPLAELKFKAEVDQTDCTYSPFIQVVPFKENLKIVNSDPVNHNIHAKHDGNSLFNFAMPNKGEMQKRLVWPGLITLNCDVHMWMSAYIFVVKHPYYAVTGADGTFELSAIPPGEYELGVWHAGWNAKANTNPEGKVIGYTYADPIEKTAMIKIEAGATASVEFTLNN